MANRKKEVYKPKPMTEGKRNLIHGLLREYDIETAEDIQDALKDLLCGTVKEMLEAEMDNHLGYESMSVLTRQITETAQSPRVSAANTVNLKWTCPRTAKAPLNRRSSPSARRTSPPLMTRSFPCTQKA